MVLPPRHAAVRSNHRFPRGDIACGVLVFRMSVTPGQSVLAPPRICGKHDVDTPSPPPRNLLDAPNAGAIDQYGSVAAPHLMLRTFAGQSLVQHDANHFTNISYEHDSNIVISNA